MNTNVEFCLEKNGSNAIFTTYDVGLRDFLIHACGYEWLSPDDPHLHQCMKYHCLTKKLVYYSPYLRAFFEPVDEVAEKILRDGLFMLPLPDDGTIPDDLIEGNVTANRAVEILRAHGYVEHDYFTYVRIFNRP